MPRPHEDLKHHTLVDHRPGGPPVVLSSGGWYAIDVVHVRADRVGAGISTYETLIEQLRSSSARAGAGVVFRSANNRRVIVLLELDGHAGFRHIKAAWDDHHLTAEHRAVAESASLTLFRMCAGIGEVVINTSEDAYAFERAARNLDHVGGLAAALVAEQGFLGASIFAGDDAAPASAAIFRFKHPAEIDAFRASSAAQTILGPAAASDDTLYVVHPVKTIG